MQIPILSGIYTDDKADFRVSLPHNLMPVGTKTGISEGYLRPFEGVTQFGSATTLLGGEDRAAINWYLDHFRVNGLNLYQVNSDGSVGSLGSVGGSGQASIDYSFDHLGVASSGNFYLWDGISLTQNTDPDLGYVKDMVFINGHWVTTDGTSLVVTDISNPFTVTQDAYGSSVLDPDPVISLLKIRNELYAVNRHTIEAFYYNASTGSTFPFTRIDGGNINKGAISTHGVVEFLGKIAFIGGGRNEPVSIWLGLNSQGEKISNREIDTILQSYDDSVLQTVVIEKRIDKDYRQLWVRLPDQILIYDANISGAVGQPIWFTIDAGIKNIYWTFNKWIVGSDIGNLGYLDDSLSSRWGENVDWQFDTQMIYNASRGAILDEIELVTLPGREALGNDPTLMYSYSHDGIVWSDERLFSSGTIGDRNKRLKMFRNGFLRNWRVQRFRGNSDAFMSFARIEARLRGLAR